MQHFSLQASSLSGGFWSQYLCAHGSGFPAGAWGWISSHSRYIHRASPRCGCVCGPSACSHLESSSRRTHTRMGGPLLKGGETEAELTSSGRQDPAVKRWQLNSSWKKSRNMELCFYVWSGLTSSLTMVGCKRIVVIPKGSHGTECFVWLFWWVYAQCQNNKL